MHSFEELARCTAPAADYWSARLVTQDSEQLQVRRDVPQAPQRERDRGVMVSVVEGGALGYCATGDVSEPGLRSAFARELDVARASAGRSVFDYGQVDMPRPDGSYRSPNEKPVSALSLREKFEMLGEVCASANAGSEIVDRYVSLWTTHYEQLFVTAGNGRTTQVTNHVVP